MKKEKYNTTLIVRDNFGATSLDGNRVYVTITVVPEFSPILMLPLLIAATLLAATILAVLILRKKRGLG